MNATEPSRDQGGEEGAGQNDPIASSTAVPVTEEVREPANESAPPAANDAVADEDVAQGLAEASPVEEASAEPAPVAEAEPAPVAEAEPAPAKPSKPAKQIPALADPGLENLVRVADEERWLATRFASKEVRQRLMALYAFNIEVARIAERVTDPRLGEIRLQWWREATEDVFRGGPVADHPTVRALAELAAQTSLPLDLFDGLLTARVNDLSAAPFETWADLEAYVDATAGGLMKLAALICAPDIAMTPQRTNFLQVGGRTWGYIQLLRTLPDWHARGRTFFPSNLRGALGLEAAAARGQDEEAQHAFAAHAVLDRAAGVQRQIARYAQTLPKEIFPAVGYVALAPLYLRIQFGRELGRTLNTPSLFARQWKLVFAAATGKL